jgi:hypothetical protein
VYGGHNVHAGLLYIGWKSVVFFPPSCEYFSQVVSISSNQYWSNVYFSPLSLIFYFCEYWWVLLFAISDPLLSCSSPKVPGVFTQKSARIFGMLCVSAYSQVQKRTEYAQPAWVRSSAKCNLLRTDCSLSSSLLFMYDNACNYVVPGICWPYLVIVGVSITWPCHTISDTRSKNKMTLRFWFLFQPNSLSS